MIDQHLIKYLIVPGNNSKKFLIYKVLKEIIIMNFFYEKNYLE